MPDQSQVFPIPFVPGIREDTDRTMLPAGSLVAASNVRTRKGGIGKANELIDAVTVVAPSSGPAFSGPCSALGFAEGRQLAIMSGHVWARPSTTTQFQAVGRQARARPVKAHWLAFTDATSGIYQPACATIGSLVAVAYYDGTSVQLVVNDASGIRKKANTFTDRDRPRIFAVGTSFVLVMRDIGTANVYAVTISSTTLGISSELLVAVMQSADDVFDAAPYTSTSWLLCYRSAATTFTTDLMDTGLGMTQSESVTCASATVNACSVYGVSTVGVWVTFDDQSAQKIAAFNAAVTATTGAVAGFAATMGAFPATMTQRSSTTIWLTWTETSASPTRHTLRVAAYDTTASLSGGLVGYAHHVRPASRPWAGTTTDFKMWLHTANGPASEASALGAWATQRKYALCTLAMNIDTPSGFGMYIEPEIIPDELASSEIDFHLPEYADRSTTDEAGFSVRRAFMPALAVIRTQSSSTEAGTAALLVYEWDTDNGTDANARRIVENGGQGLVVGGHLQEIEAARLNSTLDAGGLDTFPRGCENGFLFAPAIVKAVKFNGGGSLSPGQVYKFRATFEYITPSGRRVRSAPSNIVEVTPDAGNTNALLTIVTSPTTEREFLAPPNQTVTHVWATGGNGDTFQRVTTDSSVGGSRGNTTISIVTYLHSDDDTLYADNEPLYTEGAIANEPAPAARFGWVGGGRLWLGGLFNPQIVECSKVALPNEPVAQFTRHGAFRCLLPEPATGGAWLDGNNVVFSATGAYLIPGGGPDATGNPGVGQAQKLPSSVGCLDWRSVVELPEGIGFQSRRGFELLPRGYGEPQLLSGPVQETLRGRRIISATLVVNDGSSRSQSSRLGERRLVLCAIDPALDTDFGVRLVLDLETGRWLSSDAALDDSGALGELATNWDGKLVVASRTGTNIRIESLTSWNSGTVDITTGDDRLFGVMGRFQAHRIQLLGEIRSSSRVDGWVYRDGKYSDPLPLEPRMVTGTAGDKFILDWAIPQREFNAIGARFTVTDPDGLTTGENLVLQAIGIDATGLAGRPRVGQNRSG